jgi:DNA-directed RNA polymerase specialized sigma24 family protein
MSAEALAHPDVVQAVSGVLRHGGIAPADLGDAVADVQVRVLHALRNKPALLWPQTRESWKALSIRAAQTLLIDRSKKARRRAKTDAGACEEPDAHPAPARRPSEREPLDQKMAVELLAAHLAESKHPAIDLEIVDRLQAGQDQATIAVEMGLSHQQIRDRVRAIRKSFRLRLSGVLGSAAAAGFALLMILRSPGAPPKTEVANALRPDAPEVVLTEASPTELAADLREQARDVCRRGEWVACLDRLDGAAVLDPAGDQAPEIQAARDAAAQGMNDELRQLEAKPPRPRGH